MSEMTAKEAIEEIKEFGRHDIRDVAEMNAGISDEAQALSIRALSMCEELGLLEGEPVNLSNVNLRFVTLDMDGCPIRYGGWYSQEELKQHIRELAAAYEFLKKGEGV